MVYLSDVEFTKCLSYGKVEAQILKEVLVAVPEVKELITSGKRDPRIEGILRKYEGIYEIPDECKPNELDLILKQKVTLE